MHVNMGVEGQNFYTNINLQSLCSFALGFPHTITFSIISPKNAWETNELC